MNSCSKLLLVILVSSLSINFMDHEGEWLFYRESGQLWQVGNFEYNLKHGRFIRYDKKDKVEYDKTFVKGKLVNK